MYNVVLSDWYVCSRIHIPFFSRFVSLANDDVLAYCIEEWIMKQIIFINFCSCLDLFILVRVHYNEKALGSMLAWSPDSRDREFVYKVFLWYIFSWIGAHWTCVALRYFDCMLFSLKWTCAGMNSIRPRIFSDSANGLMLVRLNWMLMVLRISSS